MEQPGLKKNPRLYVYPEHYSYIKHTSEFDYAIKCNNEGLRDIDHPVMKSPGEFRIICLGNSYSEGIGAPQDSTWPKLLEDLLIQHSSGKITVFNAGKAGSDPFYEYNLLAERMLKYKPDLVLVALGSSDLNFYRFRGGFERFTSDGIHYRKGPAWENLYAVSYIVRLITVDILKYNYKYFMSPSEYKADGIKAIQDVYQCVERFYDLSLKNKFNLAIVFFDDGSNEYETLMAKLKSEKTIPVMDLFEYNRNIEKLTPDKRKAYYWPIDIHCNSRGYAMFARGVEWNMQKMGMIDSVSNK
jgi:lysophospholipase L1-like esterase